MKTLAKVFIWIGIISQFFLIYPIVIGVLALQKLDNATKKDDLTLLAILMLVFVSLPAGLIMMFIDEKELAENAKNQENAQATANAQTAESTAMHKDVEEPFSSFEGEEPKEEQAEEKKVSKYTLQDYNSTKQKKTIRTIITILALVATGFLLAVTTIGAFSIMYNYYGVNYLCMLSNIMLFAFLIVICINLLVRKFKFGKTGIVFLILYLVGIVVANVFALITCLEPGLVYLNPWLDPLEYNIFDDCFAVFFLNCCAFPFPLAVLIYHLVSKKIDKTIEDIEFEQANGYVWYTPQAVVKVEAKPQDVKPAAQANFESEIKNLQKMLDDGFITREEYDQMRASIIAKYYKK